MQNIGEITAISAPVEFELVGDRLRFCLVSGECRRTFTITFHEATQAAHEVMRLMAARELAQSGRVRTLKQIKAG